MQGYNNFCFSMFMTVHCVERMFGPNSDPDAQFDYYRKHINFTKVYLECFRGRATDFDSLMRAKEYFEARGVKTATAIMPCVSRLYESSARMLCFTNPDVQKLFSEYIASMGKYFGEIMIDDSLSTECTCDRCRKAKGDRTWTEFRLQLMTDFCRDYIIAPAKAVNPDVTVTLKYPTWHESFQTVGYNTETQPHMFDNTYSGTETRHTTYSIFRNPRYTSYTLIRYLQSLPPHNNRGGWFDNCMCANNMNIFAEQAEFTLMASPEEATLFSWASNLKSMYTPVLGYTLERTDGFLGRIGKPKGIPVYLPYHSRGEDHVYDFLGMCGIPTDPTVLFPEDESLVMLTAASACDRNIIEKIKAHLLRGGHVVVTSGALEKLQDNGLGEFTAMRVTTARQSGREFGGFNVGWSSDTDYFKADHDISMPVIEWMTNENEFFAVQTRDCSPNILLARSWYGKGKIWILNIPDSMSDIYDIPDPVMSHLRKFLSRDMPVWFEGQNKIAIFPRDNNTFVIKSFLEHGSVAKIHVKARAEKLVSLSGGRSFAPYSVGQNETVFRVPVEPMLMSAYSWE